MTITAVDTSVLVAALLAWHEAHRKAFSALREAFAGGRVVLPAPALVETYAVLTRLPAPHRLAPKDAHALLAEGLEHRAEIVGLTSAEWWRWLGSCASQGVGGGLAYDAALLACARKAKADRLLTLDADFSRLDAGGMEIVIP